MKLINIVLQFIFLPLVIAGAFFAWSIPRVTSDYNFNTDELIYLSRSNYWTAFKTGDFQNPIWSDWAAYDQPQLTNYIYAAVPGDRSLIDPNSSPCSIHSSTDFYRSWDCLSGPPINTWTSSLDSLKNMVVRGRVLATGISAVAIATTYYLGLVVAGPLAGVLSAVYLGYFSFFKDLSTMIMMDQILLVFLNLQLITTMIVIRSKRSTIIPLLLLGLATGLAFSAKLSAAIPTMVIYLYLGYLSLRSKKISLAHLSISALLAVVIFIALHPPLWANPIEGFIHMLTWRASQITGQNSSIYMPSGMIDKLTYSFTELFSSWPFAISSFLGLAGLAILSPGFTLLSFVNLIIFVMIIPIKWNRYLLPILPAIAVYTGALPGMLLTLTQTLTNKIKRNFGQIKQFGLGASLALLPILFVLLFPVSSWLTVIIIILTIILATQGLLMTRAMLYGFSHRSQVGIETQSPRESFTLIVPARDESEVIGHTIHALATIKYPQDLYEVLIMIRADDYATIQAANHSIEKTNSSNIRVVKIDGEAHNKAYSLNIGLSLAKHDIIGIFDAEDEPNTNILQKVNDYMISHTHVNAVQAPVHLTNLNSSWYASLNAIEYYYWFASVLPFLATKNIVPLGGNTIFIRKAIYNQIGLYDETCLTEDADLGIRLAASKIKVDIMSDANIATTEGAPTSEVDVIRQRSRWDQGYFQVLEKNNWQALGSTQKFYALYTLTQPLFRHLSFLNMVFAPLLAITGNIPVPVALLSFIPGYFLVLQLGLYLLGLSDLARIHSIKVSFWRYVSTILAFIPYQALLALATLRALSRLVIGNQSWDKTSHSNAHRPSLAILE